MKITLTKEVVNNYKDYVRIVVDKSKNAGVGSIRISNTNHRWRYTSSDFMHLLGLSVFMMAYDAEYVEGVKEKTQFKPEALEFVFAGLSPIELVSMSEGCINRKIPLKGRPRPIYDKKGKLLKGVVFENEESTPSEVASSEEEVAEVTVDEGSEKTVKEPKVEVSVSQPKMDASSTTNKSKPSSKSKDSKKKEKSEGTLVGLPKEDSLKEVTSSSKKTLGSSRVVKKKQEREVSSDNLSERFPSPVNAPEEKYLEVDQEQLKEQADEKVKNLEEELDTLKSDFNLYKEQVEKEAEESKKGSSRYSELRKSFWSRLKFLFTGK
jgi:hypothetical protein